MKNGLKTIFSDHPGSSLYEHTVYCNRVMLLLYKKIHELSIYWVALFLNCVFWSPASNHVSPPDLLPILGGQEHKEKELFSSSEWQKLWALSVLAGAFPEEILTPFFCSPPCSSPKPIPYWRYEPIKSFTINKHTGKYYSSYFSKSKLLPISI